MLDFSQLVETESRGLVAAVTVIVGDHHRAEEIVQDAFERAFRRWHRVSRLDRPGAWARRVALNGAVSAVRRSGSERRAMVRLVSEAGSGAGAAGVAGVLGTVDDPLAALDDEGVWAAVRALPRDQATAVALRYGADLGVDEIAETMQVSVAAVKSLLHRGRAALRGSPALKEHAT